MTTNLFINESLKTDIGLKRTENQDYVTFFIPENPVDMRLSGRIYIVADGVGGATDGKLASSYAADKVRYLYYKLQTSIPDPEERLIMAIQQTNRAIFDYTEERGLKQMATTMVVVVLLGDQAIFANVGDSRAYLIRNGTAEQITVDHNAIGSLVSDGLMTEEEALQSKSKNQLLRCVGGDEDVSVDSFRIGKIFPGDKILLCTDGITRYADSKRISEITTYGTPNEITDRLIDFAKKSGGVDNIGVALIEVVDRSNEQFRAMDILETQRPKRLPKNPKLSINDNRKKLYLLSSISIFVFSLFVFSGIFYFSFLSPNNNHLIVSTKSTNDVQDMMLPMLETTFSFETNILTHTPTNPATPIPTITISANLTLPSPTLIHFQPTSTHIIEATNTIQVKISEEALCVYKKGAEQYLEEILLLFLSNQIINENLYKNCNFSYFENCVEKQNGEYSCSGKNPIPKGDTVTGKCSPYIENITWIIIPSFLDFTNLENCYEKGGIIITDY